MLRKTPIALTAAILSTTATATPGRASSTPPGLEDWLTGQLTQVSQTVCTETASSAASDLDWSVNRFFLNIAPYATVRLPGLLNVTVSPEIEFSWEKVEIDHTHDSE